MTTVAAAVPTVLAAVAVGAKTLGTALAFLTATPI